VPGEVRKKKARVMWKREREVMIVDAEITAMLSLMLDSAVISFSYGGEVKLR